MWVAVGVLLQAAALRSATSHDGSEQRTTRLPWAVASARLASLSLRSKMAMGHTVGATLEFEVGVEGYEEVVVLVG